MGKYVRNNAWNKGGDFSNQDLFWYAKGVDAMMKRALNDQKSWWFFAAIHGEYVTPQGITGFPNWANITAPPSVPTSPLPSQGVIDLFWNQCQHQSWYFPPWHRGYLMALESQLRKDIVAQGGPVAWALPYWDYFGGPNDSQYTMPPAFATPTMTDGSPNPLFVTMRYGPNNDGNIFIPTSAWRAANPDAPPSRVTLVTETVMGNNLYTGSNAQTPVPGFGGPKTGFNHSDGRSGNLESNPHNLVHNDIGGIISNSNYGLMGDPGTAALDPIFYLHHANIDRMWAEWNAMGNSNPTDPAWLDGPTTRPFVMPWGGQAWYFTPMQVANLGDLNYTYQELNAARRPRPNPLARRFAVLKSLPGPADSAELPADEGPALTTLAKPPELLGANSIDVHLRGSGARAISIKLDAGVRRKVANSFAKLAHGSAPDRTYIVLEGMRGSFDATQVGVYVNLPKDATPKDFDAYHAGGVALFGLRQASRKDGPHGGGGLTLHIDITDAIDRLHLNNAFDVGSLDISLIPQHPLPEEVEITVDKISIYREEL
jgi:tyrosinase